ncbi:MAG: DUF2244 domain-containing protein [Xanthomonadales bacterium]|nr:DUF2244 domain-containing protein [Xanthomonadales bacterium]
MIDQIAPETADGEARLIVRPNRSLSAPQLVGVVGGFALVAASVSGVSWLQGNAFAPFFALAEATLLAACLVWVWRRSGQAEVISVSRQRLAVVGLPELSERFSAHPAWVQIHRNDDAVVIRCGGKQVEVGAQLSGVERTSLACRISDLLRWASQ